MDLKAGTVLREGRYVIEERLGEGGFGITYRATDTDLNVSVAVKTLSQTLRDRPEFEKFQKQFITGAIALRQCKHPHIVRVFDCFQDAGNYYMVMEYIPGQTLAELVQSGEALSEAKAVKYIRQASAALHALHQKGILHRDIKPQNIICRKESDSIVLTDMGIAWELTPGSAQTYASLLSAGFAAVEQYIPEAPRTPATDIYSLTATLYYLLTGIPPVAAPLRDRLPLSEWRKIQPKLSPGVARAIRHGLQVEAAKRPQSVRAWLSLMLKDKQAVKPQPPDSSLKPENPEKSPQAETSPQSGRGGSVKEAAIAARDAEKPAPAARSAAETGLAKTSQRTGNQQQETDKTALAKKTQQQKRFSAADRATAKARELASAQAAAQFQTEAIAEKSAPSAETPQVEAVQQPAANPQELAQLPLLSAKTPLPEKAPQQTAAQPQALGLDAAAAEPAISAEAQPELQSGDRRSSQPVQPFTVELLKAQLPLLSSKTPLPKKALPATDAPNSPAAPENSPLPAAEGSTLENEQPEQPALRQKIRHLLQQLLKERSHPHLLESVPSRQRLATAFLLTATFSTFVGAGFGFAVRFATAGKSGSTFLHAEQSFPPVKNWPGTIPAEAFSDPAETDTGSASLKLPEWLYQNLPKAEDLPAGADLNAQPEPPVGAEGAIESQSEPVAPDSAQTDAADAAPQSETLPQPDLEAADTPETPSESAPYHTQPEPKPDDWVSLPDSSFVPGSGIR